MAARKLARGLSQAALAAKFQGVPAIPMDELLDMSAATEPVKPASATSRGESGRTAPRVSEARCPGHFDPRPVALVRVQAKALGRVGEHLAWRAHTVAAWGGSRRPCTASGALLCEFPAIATDGLPTPACPCLDDQPTETED